jgi:flagellar motor switch protein FliM
VSKILTQDEIDALLASSAAATGRAGDSGDDDGGSSSEFVIYNFRRPDRVSKEQLRSLHFLHDRFALNVSTSLSAFLRAMTEVSIVSVEQFAYSEFLMSLPDPTAFYAVNLSLYDGVGALEINPSVAFTMVDRLLGGTGQTPGPNRALTLIEQNVIDSVVNVILDNLTETWRPVVNMEFRIQARETRPQMLQVTGPTEIVILLVFDIRIAETRGMVNICIPAAAIEAVGEAFEQGWQRTRKQPTPEEEVWLHTNLGRVALPVTALIETRLSARDLVELKPGDVLSLGHAATQPVDVHIGQVRRFGGRLTHHGTNAGVLIESLKKAPVQQGAAG